MRPLGLERSYPEEEHQARLILGDPVAEAWEWISRYSQSFNESMESVIWQAVYGTKAWHDYTLNRPTQHRLTGIEIDPIFWDKYEILIGKKLGKHSRKPRFS